ncbi:response regulator transcription factor [Fodinibius sp.]|uniref:response regulator transcription factor n=1 Tax=Fodinibius sp. TaxID=1872440 RepID=UPI002ACDA65F|nr:response regulator [Fodinibius sp.]MDZ7659052.1 response regulator [Fodinibius sp.]
MKLLIIEDNEDLLQNIQTYLKREGYICETAQSYSEAFDKVMSYTYDVILIDIMIPGGSGLQVLRELKSVNPETGTIIISAKNALDDKVEGLELGADDYITKPFQLPELHARIKAVNRRQQRDGKEIIDGLNYQASMRYRGPSETTQGRREGMTMIDTGVSKDLMDGKAKISLNIRDLLNSQNFSYTANTDGNPNTDFYTQREFSWSSRSATISFQYFFGERNKEQRRRDQGPNGDGPPEMEM